jgi:hypothetical protein
VGVSVIGDALVLLGFAIAAALLTIFASYLVEYSMFIGRVIYGDCAERTINRRYLGWSYRAVSIAMLVVSLLLLGMTIGRAL